MDNSHPANPSSAFSLSAGEWNDSLLGDYLWSNTNFGEAVTETMTPLTWTVIQFTLDHWIFLPGYPTVGNICGLPYLNISVFATVFHLLGRSREDLFNTMEGTLYMRLPEDMHIPQIPFPRRRLPSLLGNLARIQLKQYQGIRRLPTLLATNPGWFERMKTKLRDTVDKAELFELWHNEIRPHVKENVWSVLGIASSSADFTIKLRRELDLLAGADDANSLISNLSGSTDLLPSLGPLVGLAKVARGEMSKADYLENYGHRGPNEFELSVPRPAEDPSWLEGQLAQFHETPVDIQGLLAGQKATFDAAWERFQSRQPRLANAMRQRISESARRARLREHARSEYTRDRWLVRLFACRAGELSGIGDEVFFLTLDELLGLLSGKELACSIAARQETYRNLKELPPFPSIIQGAFDAFQWASDPHRRSDFYVSTPEAIAASGSDESRIVRGSPGSAGHIEGFVRVIYDAEDGHLLKEGEILVTVQTDVAWTLIFPRAAAVITDIGAPLSHAAIVARELGIPAVVGCGDATQRLKTGDRVRVDGGRGQVEKT